jgi:hypothetical protein
MRPAEGAAKLLNRVRDTLEADFQKLWSVHARCRLCGFAG